MSRNGVCTSARDISQTEVQEKIIFQWFFEIFFWLFFFRIQFVIGYDNIARFFVLLKGETVIIERCHIKRCMVYLPRKLPLNIALHHSCHTSKCRTLLNQRLLGPSSNVWAAKCSWLPHQQLLCHKAVKYFVFNLIEFWLVKIFFNLPYSHFWRWGATFSIVYYIKTLLNCCCLQILGILVPGCSNHCYTLKENSSYGAYSKAQRGVSFLNANSKEK